MKRATLLLNPAAGRGVQRQAIVESIAVAFRERGIATEVVPTAGPGQAGLQAAEACVRGADAVFACGGDGTVHEVLQGMIGQPDTALGVIPLGSANILARHLSLPVKPLKAALQQITYQPRAVPAGHVTCETRDGEISRYFLTMAGAGPDGALVYRMLAQGKQRFGRAVYYARAAQLFATSSFAPFNVEYYSLSGTATRRRVASAMVVRVGNLGGLFRPLIRGGSITHEHMLLSLVRSPATVGLPAWFALSWARLHRWNRMAELVRVTEFRCDAGHGRPVQVQADGEWLGQTPMTARLIPSALKLLMPPAATKS